jgi:hypothetical protein
MNPIAWVSFSDDFFTANEFQWPSVTLNFTRNGFVGKYMKILLIDAYRRADNNIDV